MTLLRRSRVESSSLLSDFFLSHKFSISKGVQSLNHSQFNFRGIRGPAFVKGASQKKIGRRNNVKARDFFFQQEEAARWPRDILKRPPSAEPTLRR